MKHGIITDRNKIQEVMQSSSIFYKPDISVGQMQYGPEKHSKFLWVGRLEKNKDPITVVKAFISYLAHSPKSELQMIYQDGNLIESVQNLLDEAGVTNPVKLVGAVEHKELVRFFHQADFIISGSHYEGSGIAIIEAMSCGCIPLLTNIPSFRKLTNNGTFGYLYEAGNPSSLFSVLMHTEQLNRQCEREKIITHFRNEFSFDAIAAKTEKILREFS